MGNQSIPSSDCSERSKVIGRARSGSSLDAAYIIADYNQRCGMLRDAPLTLDEVVSGMSPSEAEILNVKPMRYVLTKNILVRNIGLAEHMRRFMRKCGIGTPALSRFHIISRCLAASLR